MKICISSTSKMLGQEVAKAAAGYINEAISKKGNARIILSTGASQFDTLSELVKMDIDWSKVEMFHLDEYIGLAQTHKASFRKYLKERFIDIVNPKATLVDGEGNIEENINYLTKEIRKAPIDVALIDGQNAHIVFNDPPADFDTKEAFHIVHLDDRCKMQQVSEGWFTTMEGCSEKAISMTVYQIMQSEAIISSVPNKEKAEAVKKTLSYKVTNLIPATKF